MRNLLTFVAVCFSAFGAVTTSPPTIAQSMRGGVPYPVYATVTPPKAYISISGTGDWTVTRGGSLGTTACGQPCFTVSPDSGNGPATVTVNWNGQGAESLAVGVYTGTVTVTGGNITEITLTVVTPIPYATFTYPDGGYPQGCTNPAPTIYNYPPVCTITDERPPSEAFSIPAQGSSYVDPQFGHTVTRISAGGENVQYPTITIFNADDTLIMVSNQSGDMDIYNREGVKIHSDKSRGDTTFTAWDAIDPDVYWRRVGDHELWKYKLSTSIDTKAADYHGIFTSISNGGTADISDDNWWVFWASAEQQICAVDLNGLTTANQTTHTYCASFASLPLGTPDWDFAMVSELDVTGERYVVVMGTPAAAVWKVGTPGGGTLVWYRYLGEQFERNGNDDDGVCEAGENCITTPHSDLGRDAAGNVVLFFEYPEIWVYRNYLFTLQLNKGDKSMRPVEEDGGLRFLYVTDMNGSGAQYAHFGCNGNAYCVVSTTATPSPSYYRTVTGVSFVGAAPQVAQITTSAAHPWTNGKKVVLGEILGSAPEFGACLNHIWTVTYVDTTHFTLDGSNCSATGTYTSGGLAATGETIAPTRIHRESAVIYLNGSNSTVHRTSIHRSVLYGNNDYWSTPRTSISRDGSLIGYVTTMGLLGSGDELAVYIAETGFAGGEPPVTGFGVSGSVKISGATTIR